jgi:branched-subunit amino acid ABC-type transport system permease component
MKTVSIVVAVATMVLVPAYLVYVTIRTIQQERRRSGLRKVWANFGLSLLLAGLFFTTWLAHGIVQWEDYAQEQQALGEPVEVSGFVVQFGESTLENWQSEFLQLFSFVVLAAAYIHRGSAESKDSEDRIEQMVKEIKAKLDA